MRLSALWPTRRRQRANVFRNTTCYLGRAAPPFGLEMLAKKPEPPGRRPQFSPAINPPRYSEKAAGALHCVAQPMPQYSHPAPPACRVGRKCRARALRRDEYLALSAFSRCPKNGEMRRISASRLDIFQLMPISGACSPGDVWRDNASGALGKTRWRQPPNVFANAAFYLRRAPPPSGLEMLAKTRTARPSPPMRPRDKPAAQFEKEFGAFFAARDRCRYISILLPRPVGSGGSAAREPYAAANTAA